MPTHDAAWYAEHFGKGDEMFAQVREMDAAAERARTDANQARRDAADANAVTEINDGFPLIVRERVSQVEIRTPLNAYWAVVYPHATDATKGWCLRIHDNTHGDGYDGRNLTSAGGDVIGFNGAYNGGWTREAAIEAAKTWVKTGR